ncbi:MAG: (2Fe-2S)-binding protein [Candidatus Viridilinea halotolerans]|uniref:(2Fe-2S)-binding protein n=1 Tax=Candidatus Viridilinea halotolerans TaxID=2491704 RepID=A0A426U6U3_9CHLR|nr:MAG: (2Fe-2S)-binding protein [Candidatus Viridilinea halotolerans]
MPQVEMNDEMMEAKLGEPLLSVARRHAAHIGFYCDGNGLCTMCECRVIEGADQLSPVTDIERNWLPQQRLDEGYRLGCQAALRGRGTIRTITRAEELRRQLQAVLNPPEGTTPNDNVRPFVRNMVAVNWQHIGTWPFNWLRTLQRLGLARFVWPINNPDLFMRDTMRITARMLNGGTTITVEAEARPNLLTDGAAEK